MALVSLKTFLYFAYGSNMLWERLDINCPSPRRVGIAKLEKHRLDFSGWSKKWKGACATVVPDNTSHVWGALWTITNKNMLKLDNQEGVSAGVYKVYQITVEMPNGTIVECRSYHLTHQPPKLEKGEAWPEERKPSQSYLDTIIAGAKESGLPAEYIQQLEMIPQIMTDDSSCNYNNRQSNYNICLLTIIFLNFFKF